MRSPERKHQSLWLGCLLFAFLCGPLWANDSGEITAVKLEPTEKRIVISSKGTLGKPMARVMGGPNRLVMDFEGTSVGNVPPKINCGEMDIREIRVGGSKNRARVVVDFQNRPVPVFQVRRHDDQLMVIFGSSLTAELAKPLERASTEDPKKRASSPLDPVGIPAMAQAPGAVQAPAGVMPVHGSPSGLPQAAPIPPAPTASQFLAPKTVQAGDPGTRPGTAAPQQRLAPARDHKVAQMDLNAPPSTLPPRNGEPRGPGLAPPPARTPGIPSARVSASPGATGMPPAGVRELRPPVTPPTPDPRLLVQEVTELKFIQVGHNSRLVIRGGDHLDYRMNKVSPTKVRLDLINAEIPKVHQRPLRTDLFSTSVEMIVPGSQTIFIQLKDAVPYQVEKQKGVLMIDFPPPRFAAPEKKGPQKPTGDQAGRQAYEQVRETRREAVRAMRELEVSQATATRNKLIGSLQKQQEELYKQRIEVLKRYQVTPDPEIFNKPVTMDFQGITLKNAFRLLAEQAGINIIVGTEVTGTTTLRLAQVPLGQVIDTIMNANDLDREMVGNVMRIGKRGDIKKLKDERQKDYETRIGQIDKRITEIVKEIQKNQEDNDKALKALEKKEEPTTEEPVEDVKSEEVGEAGCIKIKEEDVCFYYAQVKVFYANPVQIVTTLKCMFNLDCPGGALLAAPTPVEQALGVGTTFGTQAARQLAGYQETLQQQGFSPESPGGRTRLETEQRQLTNLQRTISGQQQAQALSTPPGAAPGTAGPTVNLPVGTDPDLAKIIANSMLWPDPVNKIIFIKDTAERIAQMKKLIYNLDVPTPQVLIESRLVQATRDWGRGLGILWGGRKNQNGPVTDAPIIQNATTNSGTGSGGKRSYWGLNGLTTGANTLTGQTTSGNDVPSNFAVNLPASVTNGIVSGMGIAFGLLANQYITELDLRVQLGEHTGQTKVIARPKVQVLDNQHATIKNGRTIAFQTVSQNGTQTQLVNVDLLLDVQPTIYQDGRIKMTLKVTDNDVDTVNQVNGQAQILTREATTTMIVKDGETAVIGGILRKTDNEANDGIPGLMNIPLINTLFRSKSAAKQIQELLVFITPTIIKRPPPAS